MSIPIGSIAGRSVRYHVGASRGHYVQGTPTPTAIDRGNTYITNKRVVFRGSSQTRECLFAKLIGFAHSPEGSTTFSVSGRQKATVIAYGPKVSGLFSFRLDLAIAHHRHTLPEFIAALQRDFDEIDARQPPPAPTPPTRQAAARRKPTRRGAPPRSRWPYIALIPLGFGAWAPIYAGVKARQRTWILFGIFWSGVVLAGYIKSTLSHSSHSGSDDLAGFLIVIGWVGAIATSFLIRGSYDRRMASPLRAATEAGEARLDERRHALQTAREDPALAREMGVGRPDEPGAFDAGLIDVNNAPASALVRLPGVDAHSPRESSRPAHRAMASRHSKTWAPFWICLEIWSSASAITSYSCRGSRSRPARRGAGAPPEPERRIVDRHRSLRALKPTRPTAGASALHPVGRWTTYGEVATAIGPPGTAQSVTSTISIDPDVQTAHRMLRERTRPPPDG